LRARPKRLRFRRDVVAHAVRESHARPFTVGPPGWLSRNATQRLHRDRRSGDDERTSRGSGRCVVAAVPIQRGARAQPVRTADLYRCAQLPGRHGQLPVRPRADADELALVVRRVIRQRCDSRTLGSDGVITNTRSARSSCGRELTRSVTFVVGSQRSSAPLSAGSPSPIPNMRFTGGQPSRRSSTSSCTIGFARNSSSARIFRTPRNSCSRAIPRPASSRSRAQPGAQGHGHVL